MKRKTPYRTRSISLTLSLMFCMGAMLSTLTGRVAQDPDATLPSSKKPAPAKKPTPAKKPASTRKPTPKKAITNPDADEIAFWETIRASTDPEDFKAYIEKYPDGKFAVLAANSLKRLEAVAKPSSTPAASPPNTTGNVVSGQPAKTSGTVGPSTTMPPNPPANMRSFEFLTATLTSSGSLKSRDRKSAYVYAEDLGGGVTMELVAIPPGEFMMGSPTSEAQRSADESPQHRVRIGYWFYMGKFEVTQAQWRAVMGTNPSHFKNCDECPVEQVSWDDAQGFCRKLSARTGREYRLPSEAEWEYAARAGTTTPFAFGETITPEIVNYDGNNPYGNAAKGTYREKTIPVGSLGVANGFGLYDMHGNVWEWCQDWYHESYTSIIGDAPSDGSAWLVGGDQKNRVLRGGSWNNNANNTRSANRNRNTPDNRNNNNGFRVVVGR